MKKFAHDQLRQKEDGPSEECISEEPANKAGDDDVEEDSTQQNPTELQVHK